MVPEIVMPNVLEDVTAPRGLKTYVAFPMVRRRLFARVPDRSWPGSSDTHTYVHAYAVPGPRVRCVSKAHMGILFLFVWQV